MTDSIVNMDALTHVYRPPQKEEGTTRLAAELLGCCSDGKTLSATGSTFYNRPIFNSPFEIL
jgi:hypothetical protein